MANAKRKIEKRDMSETNTAPEYELFHENTQAIIFNYQTKAIQRMLDFDYACRRKTPSVAAIVYASRPGYHKCFWGSEEIMIPIYRTTKEAAEKHKNADVFINFASFRSSYESSLEALEQPSIRTVAIIAEGIPERKSRLLVARAKELGKWMIGPATVGGIKAGKFKIGNTAGSIENIIDTRLYVPGCVGFVSKSGGMSNELYNTISLACRIDGEEDETLAYPALNEGIAVGGDSYPGSTLYDHLIRMEKNPEVKMLVALGEVGGDGEYQIAEAIKNGEITKPLVMWVMGTCSTLFPGEVQFGHAGARADAEEETAHAKNKALKEAGAIVPNSFDDLGDIIKGVYTDLAAKKVIEPVTIPEAVVVPIDIQDAQKQGLIRKPTNFVSTISDDRGEELTYNGVPISKVVGEGYGIGGTLGLLWFKRELPKFASDYLELILVLTADHGPAVSGAHNTIVAARAGKDLVSAVASGMLTIGPRFGGAIDGASQRFKQAIDDGLKPEAFIDLMKKEGIPIPGIGHRVKSLSNPDKRVELLKNYALEHFGAAKHIKFAMEVEQLTTKKKGNLILNVDGAIGTSFIDMLVATGCFEDKEIQRFVDLGILNGLFLVGSCMGMVGHFMDQGNLEQSLYRHPWDDITYM